MPLSGGCAHGCRMLAMAKIAVVTGASSGIGQATAVALASEGFHVLAAARRMDKLAALAAQHSGIEPVELDVTDDASVARLVDHLAGRPVEVLMANAGGAYDGAAIADADVASWLQAYDVNVVGVVRTVKALLPSLVASGAATIVITGSTAGRIVYENGGSYTAAKHGTAAVAETLRLELSGQPVRVIELAPGKYNDCTCCSRC